MMRKSLFAFTILAALSIFGASASAQDATPDVAAARVRRISGSIVGRATIVSGACTKGFSAQCPSGHTCGCLSVMGAKFSSGVIGHGSASIFATTDNTAAFGQLTITDACAPTYVEIDVSASKDTPTFDATGALCFEPNGEAVFNGAMGLAFSNLFTDSGAAAFASTLEPTSALPGTTYRFRMTFKGSAQ